MMLSALTPSSSEREENVPHHTFSLPSERNIHAVIRDIPASSPEQEIKEELELYVRIYSPPRMPYIVKLMEETKRELADLKANYRKDTYANVLKNTTSAPDSINKPSLPTIIIRPKSQQNIGKNK
ncbi:unnamed protein product [Acanthoscelides obtectus]|uniref:Uncharacterized protein n=1 Tax=Acanthoscelides obtectus TaxID=200917 RepID=A0A9P0KJ76_ACAOB|nr:unnamed protein product [Acanthoscelides obtectus]CAK1671620.1 hypothetical protein AOBTE_LOCUS28366 [Acanthoscelides obtectus]